MKLILILKYRVKFALNVVAFLFVILPMGSITGNWNPMVYLVEENQFILEKLSELEKGVKYLQLKISLIVIPLSVTIIFFWIKLFIL